MVFSNTNSVTTQGTNTTVITEAEKVYRRLANLPANNLDGFINYIESKYKRILYNEFKMKIELKTWLGKEEEYNTRKINQWYIEYQQTQTILKKKQMKEGFNYTDFNSIINWENALLNLVKNYDEVNGKISLNDIQSYIENDNISQPFNPAIEYFKSIENKVSDVTHPEELEKFIKCFNFTQSYDITKMYFFSWIGGVFKNALSTDDKAYDAILIFKSKQGDGKSEVIEEYLLKPFKKYFTSTFDWSTSNKDELIKLSSNMFIYDDELSATTKGKIEDIKKITSMRNLNSIRPAYARVTEDFLRRASFIGATNESIVVNDTTGSRRFLILEINSIDLKAVKEIDFVKLWAECYHYFHLQGNKEYLFFDNVEQSNNLFKERSAEEEYLENHFDLTIDGRYNLVMTATEIIDYINSKGASLKAEQRTLKKIATLLRHKGIPFKTNVRIGGTVKGCVYYLKSSDVLSGGILSVENKEVVEDITKRDLRILKTFQQNPDDAKDYLTSKYGKHFGK